MQPVFLGVPTGNGLAPEYWANAVARRHLPPEVQRECAQLDALLPQLRRAVRTAKPEEKAAAKTRWLQAQERFAALRC